MAKKVNIQKMSDALGELVNKAERFKVSQYDILENMGRLEKAIPLFDKIVRIYDQLDPDSPRAKLYFNLAQSIASIPEGGAYGNNAYIQRTAALDDAAKAGPDDRLTPVELRDLKELMGTAKLTGLREVFDIENMPAFEQFKKLLEAAKAQASADATAPQAITQRAQGISVALSTELEPAPETRAQRKRNENRLSVELGDEQPETETIVRPRIGRRVNAEVIEAKQVRADVITAGTVEASVDKPVPQISVELGDEQREQLVSEMKPIQAEQREQLVADMKPVQFMQTDTQVQEKQSAKNAQSNEETGPRFELDSLLTAEKQRQEQQTDRQTQDAVIDTSNAIVAELQRKDDAPVPKSKVSFKSKKWTPPKGTWLGDLWQVVKWIGGAAAALGGLYLAADRLSKWFDDARRGQKELLDAYNKRWDEYYSTQEADLATLDKPEEAAAYVRGQEVANRFTEDQVNKINGYLALPPDQRGTVESFVTSAFTDPIEVAMARAIVANKNAFWYRGKIYAVPTGILAGSDKVKDNAQAFVKQAEFYPEASAMQVVRRPESSTPVKTIESAIAGVVSGGTAMLLGAKAGMGFWDAARVGVHAHNAAFARSWQNGGDIRYGLMGEYMRGIKPEDLERMTPLEQWQYLVTEHPDLVFEKGKQFGFTGDYQNLNGIDGKVPYFAFAEALRRVDEDLYKAWVNGEDSPEYKAWKKNYKGGIPIGFGMNAIYSANGPKNKSAEDAVFSKYFNSGNVTRAEFDEHRAELMKATDLNSASELSETLSSGIQRQTGVTERVRVAEPVKFETPVQQMMKEYTPEPQPIINNVTNINNKVIDGSNTQVDPDGMS